MKLKSGRARARTRRRAAWVHSFTSRTSQPPTPGRQLECRRRGCDYGRHRIVKAGVEGESKVRRAKKRK